MMLNPEYKDLPKLAAEKKAVYQNAHPFPNISFDNFFAPDFLRSVLAEFPNLNKEKGDIYYENPNEKKHATKGDASFRDNTRRLVYYLNSQPFLEFLQELTGIEETLMPDPYFIGGGFHEIKPGGFLKLHVDFHKHQKTKLDRRINLLIYLNENWEEAFGGHFELWERDMSKCAVKIAPLFNRVAIFSTTGDSWHGHPDPLTCPPDRSRKSVALYYYTNGRPDNEISKKDRKRITTTFAAREGVDSAGMKSYNRMVNLANDILPAVVVEFIKKFRNK